jgi:nucleotide-binding universal stress UspA family protein
MIVKGAVAASASNTRPERAAQIGTILLATDLGNASREATDVAMELACRLGARLLIMNALDTRRILGVGSHDRLDQARAEREEILVGLVKQARATGAAAEFMVWPGAPATAIREAIESEDVDLLVVGSHGRDRAGRLILGSVSDALVHQAPCPVLVARPNLDRLRIS